MISVPYMYQPLFKDFSLRRQSEIKCRRTMGYCMQKNTLDWRKIEMINAPLRIQQIIHLTRLDCSSFCTWFGKFSDMMEKNTQCVCVCVFSSHPFWTSSSLDVPAGVTQEEGHTGFLIHLPSAVRALIFVARRIQPFLSLVDREVEFCVLTN